MADEGVTLIGRLKEKLVDAKEQWALARQPPPPDEPGDGRLPPGQRLTEKWPILDLGVRPKVALADWRLVIDGLVANPVTWNWEDFLAEHQREMVSDIQCVTAWSRYENHWTGVSAEHLLAVVRPAPEAKHILFHSYDGYTTNVPLEIFAAPDSLLAHQWEGEKIPREHGGPVRVVIPQRYFWKSAKWLKRMEFLAEDRPGYWEKRGYHNVGDPWREERYW
jgi:DMSO/TMAO reductase YedYZ molybdopterin-dependent catalytic subunit